MKFPCTLKNALLIIRDRFGLSFASKGLGYLAAYLFLLSLLARYKLSCYQTTRYLQFQHSHTLPYWKLLVISFCSSLGLTLLLIEKRYTWSPILVGHQRRVFINPYNKRDGQYHCAPRCGAGFPPKKIDNGGKFIQGRCVSTTMPLGAVLVLPLKT